MVLNNGLLRNVFDLSALSRALEEIVLPQAGRLARAALNVFDLSSLARALDEDVTSQTARFAAAVSNAFDLSPLSRALDEDLAAITARPIIPIVNVFDTFPLSRALDEVIVANEHATQVQNVEQHEIIALNPVNTVIIPPVPVVVTDPLIILARRTEEPPVKDSLNAPTLLGQVLGEDFATQTHNTEKHRVTTLNPVNTVITSPILVNVTDLPIISARRAGKLPVKDSLRKRKLEAAGFIESPTHIPSRKRKLSDASESSGIPAKKCKYASASESPVALQKRQLSDASESFGLPATKRKDANTPQLPVVPAKRKLSDAFESFNLPAKKRRRVDAPESPESSTLSTVKCQTVISVPVDPLPVKKRKRDDAIEVPETMDPRKRRRQGAPLSDDVAHSTPLPNMPLPARKRQDVEEFASEATSTPVKQRADVEESKEIKFVPLDPLPVKKRKRDDAIEPLETRDPRKRRRQGDAPLSNVAQSTPMPTLPSVAGQRKDSEEFDTEATSTPVKQCVEVEEPIAEHFNDPAEESDDNSDGEGDVVEYQDEAWRESYLELCREVFGDGEDGDEEEAGSPRNLETTRFWPLEIDGHFCATTFVPTCV
ncbi:hypothetical protein AX14_006059 [Amanita brunnescens Koide BX004]|nr:hypothetical protein AX14_006059 [Amanita brunnescens Koide BX004]